MIIDHSVINYNVRWKFHKSMTFRSEMFTHDVIIFVIIMLIITMNGVIGNYNLTMIYELIFYPHNTIKIEIETNNIPTYFIFYLMYYVGVLYYN